MLKVVCKKFLNIVIIIALICAILCYIMIAGLPYLEYRVGLIFLVILSGGRTPPCCNTKQIKITTKTIS